MTHTEYSTAHPDYVEEGATKPPVATSEKVQPVVEGSGYGEVLTFGYMQGFLIVAVVLIIVVVLSRRRKGYTALKAKSVV